jgi:hypothetical protein
MSVMKFMCVMVKHWLPAPLKLPCMPATLLQWAEQTTLLPKALLETR